MDIAGEWKIINDNGSKSKLTFIHGTTSGRREVLINGVTLFKKPWLFRLVGSEEFQIDNNNIGRIEISPGKGLSYEYRLFVNNKPYEKFEKMKSKSIVNWNYNSNRITLNKDTMSVYFKGVEVETEGVFGENGVETHFNIKIDDSFTVGVIKTLSSGNKHEGMLHLLFVNNEQVPEF